MIHKPVRRSLVTSLALALLAVALVFVLRSSPAPYLDLMRQGDEHATRAERTAAVAAYREAASLRPGDPAPYLRLAQVYLEWGRVEQALDAIARCGQRTALEDRIRQLSTERGRVEQAVARAWRAATSTQRWES